MRSSRQRRLAAAAFLFGALGFPAATRADDPDMARANQLLEEGKTLQRQGQLAGGCVKIEESVAVRAGYAAELALADCHAALGRPGRAALELASIAARAAARGKVDAQNLATYQEYVAYAQQRAKQIAPKLRGLPRITVTLSAAVATIAGVGVKLDGVLVDPAAWNTAIPVDPGNHRVRVTAPGKKELAWEADLTTGEKSAVFDTMADERTPIDEPPQTPPAPSSTEAAEATASVSAALPGPLSPPSSSADTGSAADAPATSTARKAGIVIGLATAVAGLAIGVGFGAAGVIRRNEGAQMGCGSPGEPATCSSLETDYNKLVAAEVGGFVGVGIGLGLAAVLFVTRPAAAPRSVRVYPAVGPNGAGLWAGGRF